MDQFNKIMRLLEKKYDWEFDIDKEQELYARHLIASTKEVLLEEMNSNLPDEEAINDMSFKYADNDEIPVDEDDRWASVSVAFEHGSKWMKAKIRSQTEQ